MMLFRCGIAVNLIKDVFRLVSAVPTMRGEVFLGMQGLGKTHGRSTTTVQAFPLECNSVSGIGTVDNFNLSRVQD